MTEFFDHSEACIFKKNGKERIHPKTKLKLHEFSSVIIEGCFFGKVKPKIGDKFDWPCHKLVNLSIKEIISIRDAKTPHYPKVVDGKEYSKEDLSHGSPVEIDFKNAFFKLRLG